eukprot:TRINITY_DN4112_c0_g1_i5.p1 TRINITY_DN4112_c0_g1~~TRINITY_DN4112_c0_g1_i5.p1  ORF type:complete len:1124 (-),score=255.28 TRINITY_DN4112_c0_g1_i5:1500-4871(-)
MSLSHSTAFARMRSIPHSHADSHAISHTISHAISHHDPSDELDRLRESVHRPLRPRSAGQLRSSAPSSQRSASPFVGEQKGKTKPLSRPVSAKSATSSVAPGQNSSNAPSALDLKLLQNSPEKLVEGNISSELLAKLISAKLEKTRDVSSRNDRLFHGVYIPGKTTQPVLLPEEYDTQATGDLFGDEECKPDIYSAIPSDFHVRENTFVPPSNDRTSHLDFEEETLLWKKTVFPSRQPSNRQEVLYLAETFERMLQKTDESGSYTGLEFIDARRKIHDACYNELLRQVTVHCVERGVLMKRIWGGYIDIFESLRQLDLARIEELLMQQAKLREYYEKMIADINESHRQEVSDLKNQIARLEDDNAHLRRQIREDAWNTRERDTWKNQNELEALKLAMQRREEILARTSAKCSKFDIADNSDEATSIRLMVLRRQMLAERIKDGASNTSELQEASKLELWEKEAEIIAKVLEDYERVVKDRVVKDDALKRLNEALDKERRRVMQLLEEIEKLKQSFRRKITTADIETQTDDPESDDEFEPPPEPVEEEIQVLVQKKPKTEKKTIFGKGQVMSKKQICKIIANIYDEKMLADDIDDREHNTRQSFPEFVYDYFLHKYGLKQLAERHLASVYSTAKKLKANSVTIRLFSRFIGIDDELGLPALNYYLYVRNMSANFSVGYITSEDEEARRFISLPRATELSKYLFSNTRGSTLEVLLGTLQKSSTDAPARNQGKKGPTDQVPGNHPKDEKSKIQQGSKEILLDRFLEIVLEAWRNDQSEAADRMVAMFRAADVDHNEELEFEEFRAMVKLVDPTVSDRKCLRMFSEGLSIEGTNGLGLQSFVKICKQYSLGMITKPDSSRGERTARVNNFVQLDEEWHLARPKIARILKDISEDPSSDAQQTRKMLEERVVSFMKLLQTRREPDAAWISYRMLMAEVRNLSKQHRYKDLVTKSFGENLDPGKSLGLGKSPSFFEKSFSSKGKAKAKASGKTLSNQGGEQDSEDGIGVDDDDEDDQDGIDTTGNGYGLSARSARSSQKSARGGKGEVDDVLDRLIQPLAKGDIPLLNAVANAKGSPVSPASQAKPPTGNGKTRPSSASATRPSSASVKRPSSASATRPKSAAMTRKG